MHRQPIVRLEADAYVEADEQTRACLNLWVAVARLAIQDARQGRSTWYINSEDPREGGFVWVCELLGIDPTTARNAVLNGSRSGSKDLAWERYGRSRLSFG